LPIWEGGGAGTVKTQFGGEHEGMRLCIFGREAKAAGSLKGESGGEKKKGKFSPRGMESRMNLKGDIFVLWTDCTGQVSMTGEKGQV